MIIPWSISVILLQNSRQLPAEESALQKFQYEPFFEVLAESISRKAAEYAYAYAVRKKTLGARTEIDYMIRDPVMDKIQKLQKIGQS